MLLFSAFYLYLSFASPLSASAEAPEYLRIGTYNIQSFGRTKLARKETLTALSHIALHFDVLALQEIGSNASSASEASCQDVMEGYVARINELSGNNLYSFVRGDQFAVVYRKDRVQVGAWELYAGRESFAYSPLMVYLKTLEAPFDFILVSIHIRPSLASTEIPSLAKLALEAADLFDEKDVILAGDYNADGSYYDEGAGSFLTGFPSVQFISVVGNGTDTSVGAASNSYDRMQLTVSMIEDYADSWTVLHPAQFLDVSLLEGPPTLAGTEGALSDHYPIQAYFYTQKDSD
ncbi:hypothetical protein MASR2M78_35310 [Treponema sp.]